jgi:hypothetical protein
VTFGLRKWSLLFPAEVSLNHGPLDDQGLFERDRMKRPVVLSTCHRINYTHHNTTPPVTGTLRELRIASQCHLPALNRCSNHCSVNDISLSIAGDRVGARPLRSSFSSLIASAAG